LTAIRGNNFGIEMLSDPDRKVRFTYGSWPCDDQYLFGASLLQVKNGINR
jgi:hypothetical protein